MEMNRFEIEPTEVAAAIEWLEQAPSHPALSPSNAEIAMIARAIADILARTEPSPELAEDRELVCLALACLTTYPLLEALEREGPERERLLALAGEPLRRLKSVLERLAPDLSDCLATGLDQRIAASEDATVLSLGVRRLHVDGGSWL